MKKSRRAVSRVDAIRLLIVMSGPHRGAFLRGILATLGVVAMRLALPWPLRGVVENVFPALEGRPRPLGIPSGLDADPVLLFCGMFLLLAIGAGFFEWVQRIWMARAASHTAHDLRAAAVAAAGRGRARTNADRADLITRIIGDSARLKAGLKGIFIHLTQNAILLLAITVLFLFLAPKLGLLFLLSGLLATLIGHVTVSEVAETTERQRRKESRYAATIHEIPAGESEDRAERTLNRSSAKKEVLVTRIIGRSSLLIHAAVAATLGFAFWMGVNDVRRGALAPGELFLFIAYAITIQRRAVMIGRQVARGGAVLANAQRIGKLVDAASAPGGPPVVLAKAILLERLRVRSTRRGARSLLGPLDLTVRRREHVLVLGGDGSGKSTLLRVLAGRAEVKRGKFLWDGDDVGDDSELVRRSVAYLPDEIEFGGMNVRWLLGLPRDREPSAEEIEMLRAVGAWSVVRRLSEGLDQVVGSADVSPRERRALALGGILFSAADVWVLDEPVEGDASHDRRGLETLLERAGDRTVVVSLRRPVLAEKFDRIVELKDGRIAYQGSYHQWAARRVQLREIKRA